MSIYFVDPKRTLKKLTIVLNLEYHARIGLKLSPFPYGAVTGFIKSEPYYDRLTMDVCFSLREGSLPSSSLVIT